MYQPTLLIDEADSFLKRDDGRDNEELRGILNAGHSRNGVVIRTVGEDFEPRAFKVFGPVAYAWLVKRGHARGADSGGSLASPSSFAAACRMRR